MAKTNANFIVSCDTSADMPRSWYEKNDVKYIIMKRILHGVDIAECFDTDQDFDKFYESLKKGDQPTTTQINPFELKEFFQKLLKDNKTGDIIHIPLSSGLSATCANAQKAADEINADLEKSGSPRRVHVFDSLMGTMGIGQQVLYATEYRDAGMTTAEAIEKLTKLREGQQGWVVMTDLFHLKRGGRISKTAAVFGALLNIRPIVHIGQKGKLAIENKVRGNYKAVKYILSRMEKFGEKWGKENGVDFTKSTVWVVRTSQSELFELMKDSIRAQYPEITIKTAIVGPIIGTHLGCGGVAVLFNGGARLDIE